MFREISIFAEGGDVSQFPIPPPPKRKVNVNLPQRDLLLQVSFPLSAEAEGQYHRRRKLGTPDRKPVSVPLSAEAEGQMEALCVFYYFNGFSLRLFGIPLYAILTTDRFATF